MTIWSVIKSNGGKYTVFYTLAKALGAMPSLLLARFFSEHNFAQKNNCLINDCFFSKSELLMFNLGCSEDELNEAIKILKENDLIDIFNNHFNRLLVQIKVDNIVEFINDIEDENIDNSWDLGLKEAINPKINLNNFSSSSQDITKILIANKCNITAIAVEYIVGCIEDYENKTQTNFLTENNLKAIEDFLKLEIFNENKFMCLIQGLTKEQ